MCQCIEEAVDHLLIHCSVAFDLRCYIFQMCGIQWVLIEKVPIYYGDSGLGDLIVCQLFGTLYPYVFYGLSGWKEIDALLKMWSAHQHNC